MSVGSRIGECGRALDRRKNGGSYVLYMYMRLLESAHMYQAAVCSRYCICIVQYV